MELEYQKELWCGIDLKVPVTKELKSFLQVLGYKRLPMHLQKALMELGHTFKEVGK